MRSKLNLRQHFKYINWTSFLHKLWTKKHPLSTSRIRSVTFNRFAAENNSIRVFLERKGEREFAISSSDSLKRSARTTKKTGRGSGRNLDSLEKKETQPMGLASGLSGTKFESRDAALYLRNSGTTTKHDIVQFCSSLRAHNPFLFFFLSPVPFNSATIQGTRVTLLPYVRSEILLEADLRCVSGLRNNGC